MQTSMYTFSKSKLIHNSKLTCNDQYQQNTKKSNQSLYTNCNFFLEFYSKSILGQIGSFSFWQRKSLKLLTCQMQQIQSDAFQAIVFSSSFHGNNFHNRWKCAFLSSIVFQHECFIAEFALKIQYIHHFLKDSA